MNVSTADIRKFAVKVVELYTTRVKMTLLAQGELEREIAAQVREIAAREESVDDWAPCANGVLDACERKTQLRGIRIAPVMSLTSRVSEKRRAA